MWQKCAQIDPIMGTVYLNKLAVDEAKKLQCVVRRNNWTLRRSRLDPFLPWCSIITKTSVWSKKRGCYRGELKIIEARIAIALPAQNSYLFVEYLSNVIVCTSTSQLMGRSFQTLYVNVRLYLLSALKCDNLYGKMWWLISCLLYSYGSLESISFVFL